MGTHPTDKRSGVVTDDGAKHAERNIYRARDPKPLPEESPDTAFSKEQKERAWNLIRPDHTGK